jgi:hypothetical protein
MIIFLFEYKNGQIAALGKPRAYKYVSERDKSLSGGPLFFGAVVGGFAPNKLEVLAEKSRPVSIS